MLEDINSHLADQQAPLKAALVELVRIPSVCDENASGFSFGLAIDQAIHKALQIAHDMGYKTHYGDGGYYGFAERCTSGIAAIRFRDRSHPGAPRMPAPCRTVWRSVRCRIMSSSPNTSPTSAQFLPIYSKPWKSTPMRFLH
jgi:hypothetical protein